MTHPLIQRSEQVIRNISSDTWQSLFDDAQETVNRLRGKYPSWTEQHLERKLLRDFRRNVASTGAVAGAAATFDIVDNAAALGEGGWFVHQSVGFIFELAALYDIDLQDVERQRDLVVKVLVVAAAAGTANKVAGRSGKRLGKRLTKTIPTAKIRKLNKALGHNTVTKYGKTGSIQIGFVLPVAIAASVGGASNYVASLGIISAVSKTIREFQPTPPTVESQ